MTSTKMKQRFTHNGKQITDHLMIERNLENHTTNDINLITNLLNRQHEQIKEFYEFEEFLVNELGFEKYRKLRDTFEGND